MEKKRRQGSSRPKNSGASKASERRHYYRLSNKVLIEYRQASVDEVKTYLNNEGNIKADELDPTYLLDQISRQLSPILINIRQQSSAIAQYLDLLNQKVDVVASMLSFEKFRHDDETGALQSTETVDISENGLRFKSKKPIKPGQLLYCKIAMVGYRLGMETYGKVVRNEKIENDPHTCLVALELPYLKEIDRKNLTRYIFDKQREQIRGRQE